MRECWGAQVDWNNIIYPTTVLLAQLTDDKAFHDGAQAYFQKWLCRRAAMPPTASHEHFVSGGVPLPDAYFGHHKQDLHSLSELQAACKAQSCCRVCGCIAAQSH